MKFIKAITHPYTLIISFFAIIISGTHFGGFYLLYLLLALPHGGSYSLIALLGILIIIISRKRFKESKTSLAGPLLNVLGAILLILSLFAFFLIDKDKSNYDTFRLLVPQITLSLFFIFSFAFLTENLLTIFKTKRNKNSHPDFSA